MDRKKCRPCSDFESHPPPLFPAHLHQPLPGSHPRRLVVAAEHVHRDNGRIVLAVRQDALVRLVLELRVQALDCVGGADRLLDCPAEASSPLSTAFSSPSLSCSVCCILFMAEVLLVFIECINDKACSPCRRILLSGRLAFQKASHILLLSLLTQTLCYSLRKTKSCDFTFNY